MIKLGRTFYALAIVVYGIQQFVYGDFRNVLFPPWQQHLPGLPVWAYSFGVYLIVSGTLMLRGKHVKNVALGLGGVFLFLFCFCHIPYELISEPNKSYHLGLWVNALKELALAGGAFVIAETANQNSTIRKSIVLQVLEKISPYGSILFCFTMISFGIAHFMYAEFVSTTVPKWFPDPMFWTYFAGVALIGSGTCIVLNIRMQVIALLLGLMIFLWFACLHVPGAINDPFVDRGNLVASAFDALAFSGIAWSIAFGLTKQKWIEDIAFSTGQLNQRDATHLPR